MSKRGALILSVILTAFILVLVGGVVARVLPANTPVSEAAPPPSTSNEREQPRPAPSPAPALTPEQAAAIASSFVPGARPAGTPELVSLEGTLAYEVRLDRGSVYLDANSGRLLQDGTRRTGGSQRRWEDDDDEHEHEREKHFRGRSHRERERHEYEEDV